MGETGKRKVIVNGRGREWLNRINDKWKSRERLNGRGGEAKWAKWGEEGRS